MASVMSIPMNTAHAVESQPIVFHMVRSPFAAAHESRATH